MTQSVRFGIEDPGTDVAASTTDLVRVYGSGESAVRAVDGITTSFQRGQFTAVMGPSGSGKSTFLHNLAGLDQPTSGQINIGDTDLTKLSRVRLTRLRRDRIGFVFQAFNLLSVLTAEENITLTARLGGRPVDSAWLSELTTRLGITDRLRHRPGELSGGQQQRVAIARALVTRPDVVFADEPTGNLDSRAGSAVLRFLREAVDDFHQTVVMVTHDPRAAAHADRVLFLADGRVVDDLDKPCVDAILARLNDFGSAE